MSTFAASTRLAPAVSRTPRTLNWVPILLGILTAVGPVSTDIYLPAFPALEESLHAAAGSAQFTLAIWFVGLALGQVTMGPLSDRYGRRLPMLIGGAIYTAASVGCATASDIWSFSVWRLLAALGASASLVVPSATVRDIADGPQAARMMSTLVLIMGTVPVLAPTLGGMLLGVASWRFIFWAAAFYGLVSVALVWRTLPETLPPNARASLPPVALLARYLVILRDRQFSTNALTGGFSAFITFAYLGGAPGVFIRLFHFSPTQFGVLFGVNAMCMIGAAHVNGRIVRRFGVDRLLRLAVRGAIAGAATLTVSALSGFNDGTHSALLVIVPVMLALAPLGLVGPNATVSAMANHASHAGSASALLGTTQYALGAISGLLIGMLPAGTVLPMAAMMLLGALGMGITDHFRQRDARRHGMAALDLNAAPVAGH